MSDVETIGYAYQNPNDLQGGGQALIEVTRIDESSAPIYSHYAAARAVQKTIQLALADRFAGVLDLDQVSQTADPDNEEIVGKQARQLLDAGGPTEAGSIVYVSANMPATPTSTGRPQAGIGKLKYADGRPRWQRMAPGGNPANLADIGDVYVRPESLTGTKYQHRGVGTAIWRTMLDYCPEDMPTIVYEFPELEYGLPAKLREKGFKANGSRLTKFCGVETRMINYRGPVCGDLIEMLEAAYPWLADREPITAPA